MLLAVALKKPEQIAHVASFCLINCGCLFVCLLLLVLVVGLFLLCNFVVFVWIFVCGFFVCCFFSSFFFFFLGGGVGLTCKETGRQLG